MSGDGGFAMLMGDLLTLRQHELPVKLIVFKNDSLAFVELEMKAAGILDFGTDLRNPDFTKIAEGAGLLGLASGNSGPSGTDDCAGSQIRRPCVGRGSVCRARNSPCRRRLLSSRPKASACS